MKDTIYEENRLPEGRMPALRVEPMPADTNQHGDVFGGWVMSQVDLAGASTAMRYALSRYIVTRAVSSLTFEAPVMVGDVVSFYTDIIRVGRTSPDGEGGGVCGASDQAVQQRGQDHGSRTRLRGPGAGQEAD